MRKSRNHEFHDMPGNALASTLLANVTEATLQRLIFALILAVPSARRRCIKILFVAIIMGVILGGFTIYYAARVFDSYLGSTIAKEKVMPDKGE
jgi:hypothetical protein